MTDVTVLLNAIEQGEARTEELLPMVYGELRRLAADQMNHERVGLTLQATALVHEAFLRLVDDAEATWQNRRHFFGAAAIAMQRILVEQARRKKRLKHGGERQRVDLSNVDIVADTLTPEDDLLAILDQHLARIQQPTDSGSHSLINQQVPAGFCFSWDVPV
jgi:RNA polymerase sigma factor (TIGR02999 family)